MDAQDFRSLQEAYLDVYEGIKVMNKPQPSTQVKPPMDDFAAGGGNAKMKKTGMSRDQVVAQGKKNLTNSYDLYDIILSHLLDEGYAETQEQAEAIMVNMSEEWRENIVEAEVLSKLGGVEGTGVGKDFKKRSWTDTEKLRYSSYKKPTAPTAAPAAAQKNNEFTKSGNMKQKVHTSGTVAGADGNYRAQSAKDKHYRSIASNDAADDIISWNKYDRNDPKVKQAAKDWADTHYRQNTALDTNDPNYNPRSIKYPDFSKFKRAQKSPRQSFDEL
jgi:hypothetical protein